MTIAGRAARRGVVLAQLAVGLDVVKLPFPASAAWGGVGEHEFVDVLVVVVFAQHRLMFKWPSIRVFVAVDQDRRARHTACSSTAACSCRDRRRPSGAGELAEPQGPGPATAERSGSPSSPNDNGRGPATLGSDGKIPRVASCTKTLSANDNEVSRMSISISQRSVVAGRGERNQNPAGLDA